MPLSHDYEDIVLDQILGVTQMTYDSSLYMALGSDTTPSKSTFTEITTPGSNGYARQAITFNASGTDGIAENSGSLTFGPCATTNWGTLKSFAIYTASSGGTRVIQAALSDQTKTISIGESATVAAGAITVTAS